RAIEMNCDALLKGTQVDGVYTADPKLDPTATRYNQVAYDELLIKNLRVMDPSAVSQMRDNNIPIVVFSLKEEGTLLNVLHGRGTATTVSKREGAGELAITHRISNGGWRVRWHHSPRSFRACGRGVPR